MYFVKIIPLLSRVRLTIYDISGKEVNELINEKLNSGYYQYEWDAAGLSGGVYFYRLESRGFSQTKRMMLIK